MTSPACREGADAQDFLSHFIDTVKMRILTKTSSTQEDKTLFSVAELLSSGVKYHCGAGLHQLGEWGRGTRVQMRVGVKQSLKIGYDYLFFVSDRVVGHSDYIQVLG